jgi:hypothetical protein
MRANQLRLWFASMAYALLSALRRRALAHTELARATCGTIRTKLLKIGALVTGVSASPWPPPILTPPSSALRIADYTADATSSPRRSPSRRPPTPSLPRQARAAGPRVLSAASASIRSKSRLNLAHLDALVRNPG